MTVQTLQTLIRFFISSHPQAHLINGPLPERMLRKAAGAGTSLASLTAQHSASAIPPLPAPLQMIGGQASPRGDYQREQDDDREQPGRSASKV